MLHLLESPVPFIAGVLQQDFEEVCCEDGITVIHLDRAGALEVCDGAGGARAPGKAPFPSSATRVIQEELKHPFEMIQAHAAGQDLFRPSTRQRAGCRQALSSVHGFVWTILEAATDTSPRADHARIRHSQPMPDLQSSWCYINPEGKVKGPYSTETMIHWVDTGMINPYQLRVAENGAKDFRKMDQVFPLQKPRDKLDRAANVAAGEKEQPHQKLAKRFRKHEFVSILHDTQMFQVWQESAQEERDSYLQAGASPHSATVLPTEQKGGPAKDHTQRPPVVHHLHQEQQQQRITDSVFNWLFTRSIWETAA